MKYKAIITRVCDGETATMAKDWMTYELDDGYPTCEYNWNDGNFGCDCNRRYFFHDARGEERPEDSKCGDDAFHVRLEDVDTGQLLYDDKTPFIRIR